MHLETVEEQVLLEVAEELGRLAVRLRAIDRLADAIDLEDLIQRQTSTLSFIRASREQEKQMEEQGAIAAGEPVVAEGKTDLGEVREGSALLDQLRGILGSTG